MKVFEVGLNEGNYSDGIALVAAKNADNAVKILNLDDRTKVYTWLYPSEIIGMTYKTKEEQVITFSAYVE